MFWKHSVACVATEVLFDESLPSFALASFRRPCENCKLLHSQTLERFLRGLFVRLNNIFKQLNLRIFMIALSFALVA